MRAEEAADALGVTARAIRARAGRQGWKSREVAVPGAGKPALEYHVDSLPAEAKAAWERRQIAAFEAANPEAVLLRRAAMQIAAGKNEQDAIALSRLTGAAAEVAYGRVDWLNALAAFREQTGLGMATARLAFAEMAAAGTLPEMPAGDVPSARTLARWQTAWVQGGVAALAPAYGKKSGREYRSAITEKSALGHYVLGKLFEKGRYLTATMLREGALAYDAQQPGVWGVPVPSTKTFQRFLTWLEREKPTTWATLMDPHAARGKVMPAFGSASEDATAPNVRWELDSTLADVLLDDVDPATGEVRRVRYHLLACVDVYTRRAMLLVSARSRSTAIAALLRKALLAWGVPEQVKMDNGKDYTSRHIEGVLAALKIERKLCPPFSPWHKPHVERLIGTFQRQWLTLVDGYTGASVAERREIDARRKPTAAGRAAVVRAELPMTAAELQALADEWAQGAYLHAAHEGLHGQTPFDRARGASGADGRPLARIESERALDVLLAKPAGRKGGLFSVGKKGIRYLPPALAGTRRPYYFTHPELVADERIGREVVCLEEEGDIGRLYVFDAASNAFVCVAECPEIAGTSRAEAAALGTAAWRARSTEIVAAARRTARDYAAQDTLGHIRARATGQVKVVGQIAPAVGHDTDALRAAEAAAEALATRKRGPAGPIAADADDWAVAERMAAEQAAREAADVAERDALAAEAAAYQEPAPEPRMAVLHTLSAAATRRAWASDWERYSDILDRLGAGEGLSGEDEAFRARYESAATGAVGTSGTL